MKPCSAWCRPDEGVHVWVGSWVHGVEAQRRAAAEGETTVGSGALRPNPNVCVPAGTRIRYVNVEPAHEAIPPYPGEIPTLRTVHVLG